MDDGWYQKAIYNIKDSEYEIRWQESFKEYQSPNRSQNLRFSYYGDGFKVQERERKKNWEIRMRIDSYGRNGKKIRYGSGKIKVDKNKGYVKGYGIDISFENNQRGMREDFIVKEKVKGEGKLELLIIIDMEKVKMSVREEYLSFVMDVPGGGEVLRYGDMKITDKRGKEIKGYFKSIDKKRFAIIVEDKNAEYPIMIDPLSSTPNWTGESNQEYSSFGCSVSSAGDVNGDGYSDVIIGVYGYDNVEYEEGGAFVYYGNGRGVPVSLRQLRGDLSRPVVPPLLSYSIDSFGIEKKLYSSYGRALVKGQIEVKQLGVPFDGTGLIETDWIDLNEPGKNFQKAIDGLSGWTLYKWRFRIKYHLKYGESDLHSRWYYIQSNALTEADFRTNLNPLDDQDSDGVINGNDCRPLDSNIWYAPSESISQFKITKDTSGNLSWVVPSSSYWGSTSVTIDILRSTNASDFYSANCIETNLSGDTESYTDTTMPGTGVIWYYLIRIENPCGSKIGKSSNGNPRSGRSCP